MLFSAKFQPFMKNFTQHFKFSNWPAKSPAIRVADYSRVNLLDLNVCQRAVHCSSFLFNHYDVLGVKPDATKEEIKRAYIELSKVHHPDKLLKDYNNSATKDFLQIKEAFDTLSNDKCRLEYDMKTMKRSGDYNRFSTGEYSLYTSKERAAMRKKGEDGKKSEDEKEAPVEKPSLGRLIKLLGQVYAAIAFTGLALYFLSKKFRKKS